MREKKWMVHAKNAPFQEIGKRFAIDQVTARIIRNRDITTDEEIQKYLFGTEKDLYDPTLLKNADKAVSILSTKIKKSVPIRIIGDYDIDGISSVYILYKVLLSVGAKVDYDVPERIRDGYGLNQRFVEEAFDDGIDTIITCDNGISAIEQIKYAKKLGLTVIVTDHHMPVCKEQNGEKHYLYPPADVLIDPHIPGETYPYPEICGAVVAWKVMELLMRSALSDGTLLPERYEELHDECLQFAAIATIGDVMQLLDENRIIVKEGLKRLADTKNVGLSNLIRVNELTPPIKSSDIGFIIGPCMNASGRLENAVPVLQLLCEQSEARAYERAKRLCELNEERKEITNEGLNEAISLVEQQNKEELKVLVIYLPDTHESVAGIIAGKVKEYYHHPTFVLTDSTNPAVIKGSGRSIKDYIMHEALENCSDLLLSYGGHPMAAGLSLKKENLQALRDRLNADCTLSEDSFIEKVMIDVPMPIGYVTTDLIKQFSLLEPFGNGNPRPVFAEKNVQILSMQIFGKNRNVLRMRVQGERNAPVDAVLFGEERVSEFTSYLATKYSDDAVTALMNRQQCGQQVRITILYDPQLNVYMQRESVQIHIRDYL